jgi:hypothetical protein
MRWHNEIVAGRKVYNTLPGKHLAHFAAPLVPSRTLNG